MLPVMIEVRPSLPPVRVVTTDHLSLVFHEHRDGGCNDNWVQLQPADAPPGSGMTDERLYVGEMGEYFVPARPASTVQLGEAARHTRVVCPQCGMPPLIASKIG